jgi:hypothetical protein
VTATVRAPTSLRRPRIALAAMPRDATPPLPPLADWRDRFAYPLTHDGPRAIAWACLRRSPEYRRAWLARDPRAATRFGVERMADPASANAPRFLGTCADLAYTWDAASCAAGGALLWVALDPRKPTAEQLVSAARLASEELARAHRADPKLRLPRVPAFPKILLALRAFDARAAGVSDATIADRLVLTEAERFAAVAAQRRAAARKEAARAVQRGAWLVEHGYRAIAVREVLQKQ